VSNLADHARRIVESISDGYRPSPKPFGLLRILFAVQVLATPRGVLWVAEVPAQFFNPPPGPFSILSGPPSSEFLIAFTVVRALIAVWLLIGWRTLYASVAMTVALIVGSGLGYSFSKVDHFILYDLAPLAFGIAGWGAAFSLDALRRRSRTHGYPMFLFGLVVAFALFTAAVPKFRGGWWNPAREATRLYVSRDAFAGPAPGPLGELLLSIDSTPFWKLLDYGTLFAEGWLIVAVFFPGLFRIGLMLITLFHIGVFATLGIDFFNNIWAYAGFFCLPSMSWFPEFTALRRRVAEQKPARPIGAPAD
jgi:hypothetical protein